MSKLSVYANEYEWVIADSLDRAIEIVKETTGYEYQDDEELGQWHRLRDDATLSIWFDETENRVTEFGEDDAVLVTRTHRAWIREMGEGYLCSTEF